MSRAALIIAIVALIGEIIAQYRIRRIYQIIAKRNGDAVQKKR
jgi:hypothetical protein